MVKFPRKTHTAINLSPELSGFRGSVPFPLAAAHSFVEDLLTFGLTMHFQPIARVGGAMRKQPRDEQWKQIEGMLPGKVGDRGRSAADNRLFVEAVLWIARTGSPWRDLPAEFRSWNSTYERFARGSRAEVWRRVFAALAREHRFARSSSTPPSLEPTSMPLVPPKKTALRRSGDPEAG